MAPSVPGRQGVDHLPSAPMPRVRAAVILATGLSIAALGSMAHDAGAEPLGATPPTSVAAPPTTPPPSVVPTTVPADPAVPATTVATITAVRRGGAAAGSIAKPEDEQWSLRRMVTTTGLCVLALAVLGYGYGRVRSTPPRHPDLVRSPD